MTAACTSCLPLHPKIFPASHPCTVNQKETVASSSRSKTTIFIYFWCFFCSIYCNVHIWDLGLGALLGSVSSCCFTVIAFNFCLHWHSRSWELGATRCTSFHQSLASILLWSWPRLPSVLAQPAELLAVSVQTSRSFAHDGALHLAHRPACLGLAHQDFTRPSSLAESANNLWLRLDLQICPSPMKNLSQETCTSTNCAWFHAQRPNENWWFRTW